MTPQQDAFVHARLMARLTAGLAQHGLTLRTADAAATLVTARFLLDAAALVRNAGE